MLVGIVYSHFVIKPFHQCTATYSLSKYEDQQTNIEMLSGHTALVHNNNLIDSAIVTIVFCVLVATIFGADFFFLVLWPQRQYPLWYHTVKKFLAVVIALGMGIAAFTSTVSTDLRILSAAPHDIICDLTDHRGSRIRLDHRCQSVGGATISRYLFPPTAR